MVDRYTVYTATGYAVWLSEATQAISEQQHIVRFVFSADNTTASFDKISYATCKVLPVFSEQE
jgi:hypothetical protein